MRCLPNSTLATRRSFSASIGASLSMVLYTIWGPYRSWYHSYGSRYVPERLFLAYGAALHLLLKLLSSPWRLTRRHRLASLSAEMQDSRTYYPVACRCCGTVCPSSSLIGGGSNYAGDYDEVFCGVCLSNEKLLEE